MSLIRCAVAALCASAGIASADVVNIFGAAGDSSFTGSLNYTPGTGTLVVSLTNTTPTAGGFITGFVFNIDSADANASAVLQPGSSPFQGVQNASASPFGTFDAGAALGGNFEGGGNPTVGIAVGATRLFTFLVSASDSASLSASDFYTGGTPGFVVRTRGLNNGGSDKIPGVPAPGALTLAGLAGLAALRRR